MPYYAVSYQLNKAKNYQPLWDAFEEMHAHKAMRDFYLLDVDATAYEVRNFLEQFVDDDDMVFVVPFSIKPSYNRAAKGTNDWMSTHFK